MALTISELFIYPVKSLSGIPVNETELSIMGFKHDRRWMLVDSNNTFITQREVHAMALLQTAITNEGLHIFLKQNTGEHIFVPIIAKGKKETIRVWGSECAVFVYDKRVNDWFSDRLHIPCRLVYMPDDTQRLVDTNYAKHGAITAFTDGYPLLIIGQSSLDLLNSKLATPIPINRFRPNIVFTGADAHAEDNWKHFAVNQIDFYGVKTCSRCVITTIDQQTATAAKEPLQTLATYRMADKKIKFGMNLLHKGSGLIRVNDEIKLIEETIN
jgi:uncharacterized protein YcbX